MEEDLAMTKTIASALALAAAAAVAVTLAGPASAQEVVGVYRSFDTGQRILILEDGTRLYVAEGVTLRSYEPGAKVRFFVEERDGRRYITRVITPDE